MELTLDDFIGLRQELAEKELLEELRKERIFKPLPKLTFNTAKNMNITLSVLEWRDLANALDSIPPKNHSTTAEARKCTGSVEQIRSEIKPQLDELEILQREALVIMTPHQDRLRALGDEKEDTPEKTKKRKKIQDEVNLALEDVNRRAREMQDRFIAEQAAIKLDENYKSYIKSIWEAILRPMYTNTKVMVKIADAFSV